MLVVFPPAIRHDDGIVPSYYEDHLLERVSLLELRLAQVTEQIQFIEDFKQTLLASDENNAVITFDEFSISSKPSNYYGWAERNTRPRVKTDEKNAAEPMDS